MKKLSVFLVAAVVAFGASAGIQFKATHAMKSNKIINTEMTKMNVKDIKAQTLQTRVITTQPEGELKTYNRAGQYDYVSSGYLYCDQQDGKRMDIVYAEDGKVYLKNILCGASSYFGTDSWVEGTIEDNVITVPLGQSIAYVDSYQADIILCWGNTHVGEEENSIYFDMDDNTTAVTYVINGETITMQNTEGATGGDYYNIEDYFGTGLSAYWSDDDSWTGFIEWNTVLTEREPVVTPTVITEIPEGCQVYSYYRNSACIYNSFFGISSSETDGKLNVAFDMTNGDVYIQNPSWWHDGYGAWVKGTYDWMTGIITVPVGQYLSWSDAYEYGIVLGWGYTYVYEGEDGYYMGNELDDRTTEIQFMIDDDYIYLLGTEGDINAEFPDNYNATGMYTYWSDDLSWTALEFCNRDEYGYAEPFGYMVNLVPAVPANPTADEWYDCGDESGYSRFYFTLPDKDVDGNIMLNPENLSYSIFVDNGNGAEKFIFPAAVYYYDIDEDIDEVPYEIYSSGYDFYADHTYFYRTNAEGYEPLFTENIGIQVYYDVPTVSIREKNASDIVWLYDTDVAVKEVNAGKTVANVRFFNLAGQEMAQPEGLTIKVTTYTDGTSSAVKVVK